MKRIEKNFRQNLSDFELTTLENSEQRIYGLLADLRFAYFNPAFRRPLDQQEAIWKNYLNTLIGTPIQNVLKGAMKDFYVRKYQAVLDSGEPWHHQYECSDAERYRSYHIAVYPLKSGKGIIVSNALRVETPMNETRKGPAYRAIRDYYTDDHGMITQCSNCLKVQRPLEPGIWDWVTHWVDNIPNNCSHSICPICFDYHWKGA